MRAAILRDGRLTVDNLPDPVPGEGQVLVRTRSCGICGTDLHAQRHLATFLEGLARSGSELPTDAGRDVVFGHEFCAEIIDYGPGTQRTLAKGATVVGLPFVTGPAGREYVGYSNRFPGGFAELMVLTERLLFAVPDGVSPHAAAMTEPFAVGEHAVVRAAMPAEVGVLIVGSGPIGLAVLAALKTRGVGPIVVTDFSPTRLGFAEALGADELVDAAVTEQREIWSRMGLRRGQRPVAFECVGRPGVAQQVLEHLPRGGLLAVIGNSLEPSYLDQVVAFNKEVDISFAMNYSHSEFGATLGNIAEGRIDVTPVLTGSVFLDRVEDAFTELANADQHVKIMVEFD